MNDLSIEERIREYCLRALERRLHSRRELELKLARKGYRGDAVVEVLDRFTQVGLVDDEAFAKAFVQERQARRPRGARALTAELSARGVSREIIGRVLEEDLDDPYEAALRALAPKVNSLKSLKPHQGWQRGMGFLQRRGFDGAVSRAALEQLLKHPEED